MVMRLVARFRPISCSGAVFMLVHFRYEWKKTLVEGTIYAKLFGVVGPYQLGKAEKQFNELGKKMSYLLKHFSHVLSVFERPNNPIHQHWVWPRHHWVLGLGLICRLYPKAHLWPLLSSWNKGRKKLTSSKATMLLAWDWAVHSIWWRWMKMVVMEKDGTLQVLWRRSAWQTRKQQAYIGMEESMW